MLISLSGWALSRARTTRSRRWLRVFDVLRALELALAGLPADQTATSRNGGGHG